MLQSKCHYQRAMFTRFFMGGVFVLSLLTITGIAQDAATATKRPLVRRLTNQTLEVMRKEREKTERLNNLKPAHLPTEKQMEESRARDEQFLRDASVIEASQQKDAESYWRARSNALRTEISTLDAQINYLRTRIVEISTPVTTPYAVTTAVIPSYYGRHSYYPRAGFPAIYGQPTLNQNAPLTNEGLVAPSQLSGRVAVGRGAIQGEVAVNTATMGQIVNTSNIFPGVYGSPSIVYTAPANDYSYERDTLVVRFNELQTQRAGLMARWRALEDEARVAGAQPGWLR